MSQWWSLSHERAGEPPREVFPYFDKPGANAALPVAALEQTDLAFAPNDREPIVGPKVTWIHLSPFRTTNGTPGSIHSQRNGIPGREPSHALPTRIDTTRSA